MNKNNIIIGSICVLAILILVSFTSVVGYQSTKNKNAKTSPLFNIRTGRAIDQENEDFMCDYIGKSEVMTIFFPPKNNTIMLFQKAIDSISKMDDLAFNRFVDKVINKLCESNVVIDEDLLKIKELFHFLRDNPEDAKKYPFDLKKHSYTIGCPSPTFQETPESCFKLFVILGILIVTFPIWFPIYLLMKFRNNLTSRGIIPTCSRCIN